MALASAVLLFACETEDRCHGEYQTCTNDEQCHLVTAPYGKCLDDGESGRVCAIYWFTCPTKLKWYECAGNGEKKSSWADRCVRPEFLPDGFTTQDGSDMSAQADGGTGPS